MERTIDLTIFDKDRVGKDFMGKISIPVWQIVIGSDDPAPANVV